MTFLYTKRTIDGRTLVMKLPAAGDILHAGDDTGYQVVEHHGGEGWVGNHYGLCPSLPGTSEPAPYGHVRDAVKALRIHLDAGKGSWLQLNQDNSRNNRPG